MALVANPTKISIPDGKLPTGYTDTAGANLVGSQPSYKNYAFTIAKATVATATKATTFDAIRTQLEADAATVLGADLDDTVNTINYNIDFKNIADNQDFNSEFYTDVAAAYICTVDIYINIS